MAQASNFLLEATSEALGHSNMRLRYRLARMTLGLARKKNLGVQGAALPVPLRPGNPKRGAAWLDGDYSLPGGQVRNSEQHPFAIRPPTLEWLTSLHNFDWMRHVLASGNAEAVRYCGRLMAQWSGTPPLRNLALWRADVTGRRLISWSMAWPLIQPILDNGDKTKILDSASLQARWLARTAELTADGLPRLDAAFGLAHSALFLDDGASRLRGGIEMVSRELRRQFFVDGGHLSRRPDILAAIAFDLIAIEAGLQARDIEPPAQLNESISRIVSMVRLLRHSDGTMALFNGGLSLSPDEIEPLLQNTRRKKASSFAQKSGYQRMEMGKSCVIVDVGKPPRAGHSCAAHAAPLAFEMSHGASRLIVNCGPNLVDGTAWRLASRTIAAHSTLAFDQAMDDPFLRNGFAARVLGPRLILGKIDMTSRRAEDKTGIWLEAAHDLFCESHGVRHNRRLYLNETGEDLRGEDILLPTREKTLRSGAAFTLRFHLHPAVTCARLSSKLALLLVQPGGAGWQFHLDANERLKLDVEESVYMGDSGGAVRSQQITIRANLTARGETIRWALRHVGQMSKRKN